MDLNLAALIAMSFSFVVIGLLALWHGVPRLRTMPRSNALTALLWIHAFRHIALQIFSSQQAGFAISDLARNEIVYGDLLGALLALVSIVALRLQIKAAVPLIWVFVVATVLDLGNALRVGLAEQLLGKATDVSWLILTFYVPLLWISTFLIVWLLVTRKADPARK